MKPFSLGWKASDVDRRKTDVTKREADSCRPPSFEPQRALWNASRARTESPLLVEHTMSSSSHYSPTPEELAISRLLCAHREHQGLTAVALAESIGVTAATNRRIERGERPASLIQLQQICQILRIDLDDLADSAKRLMPEPSSKRSRAQISACHGDPPCVK